MKCERCLSAESVRAGANGSRGTQAGGRAKDRVRAVQQVPDVVDD